MLLANLLFVMALGFYLITNLQWYDYKIGRVVLKHHKPLWHFTLFVFPFILYYIAAHYFLVILIFRLWVSGTTNSIRSWSLPGGSSAF